MPLPLWTLVFSASAQDLEDRSTVLEETEKKLDIGARFETEWHEYDNLDFRGLDESSDQAILDSDDRNGFAFTGVSLDLGYDVHEHLNFTLGASYRGLWGNDQFGNVNVFGGFVYFTAMYAETVFGADDRFKLRVGRQFFSLGGNGNGRQYVLSDILDMVRFDIEIGIGRVILVPVNVVSQSGSNEDATFVSFLGQSTTQTFGFRGEHMTRRHGAVVELDAFDFPFEARAYAFYTDIGALGSGSDISYNGALGNFADNDWVANFGVRAQYTFGPVTPYVQFDQSSGVDRKELVAQDVDTNGSAFGAGLSLTTGDEDNGLRAEGSFFYALGPAFGEDGMQYSHGYVGMKGQHMGGTIMNRFLGWHPSAYVGMFGISDDPHEIDRKSGSMVASASAAYEWKGKLEFGVGWWYAQDVGVTYLNQAEVQDIDPPFGYAREAFEAEARMGLPLGQEIDIDVAYSPWDEVQLYANGAVLLPGTFYELEVARVAGTAMGGQAAAWAFNGGTRVQF